MNTLFKIKLYKTFVYPTIFMVCFIFLYSITTYVNADINTLQTSSIAIETIPENPGPFEFVSLKISSYSMDTSRANISWYVNSKLILSGIGKTSFFTKTGDIGSVLNISITIQTNNGEMMNKSISIKPAEIALLWEAIDSYTPPFYRGKALPSSQSTIKITAVPDVLNKQGDVLDLTNIIYKWRKNYKYRDFNDQSGYGKYFVIFDRDMLRSSEVVEVMASSFNKNTFFAKGLITFPKFSPKIVFYEKNLLEGVLYNKALSGETKIDNRELAVIAEPYFFSSKNGNKDISALSYIWSVNDKKIENTETEKKNEIVLRREKEGGTAKISLNMRHLTKILQFAGGGFNVSF